MIRVFIGIPVQPEIAKPLVLMQGGVPGARWVPRENFHITIAFPGNVAETAMDDLNESLEDIDAPAFALRLRGAGCFDKGDKTSHLYAGVDREPGLLHLKTKVDHALDVCRIPFERRNYLPHVTLARLNNADEHKAAEFIREHNLYVSEVFDVTGFALYRSHQTKNGSMYEVLRDYPLRAVR
jgi:2'-5' RNA ligase